MLVLIQTQLKPAWEVFYLTEYGKRVWFTIAGLIKLQNLFLQSHCEFLRAWHVKTIRLEHILYFKNNQTSMKLMSHLWKIENWES